MFHEDPALNFMRLYLILIPSSIIIQHLMEGLNFLKKDFILSVFFIKLLICSSILT